MVTNQKDAINFYKILLNWCTPQVARMMLDDMDFYIADTTDNESVRKSIKMVRQLLYSMSDENKLIDEEEKQFKGSKETCCRNGCEKCEQ